MTDYTPTNPKIYNAGELRQAIEILEALHDEVDKGKIDQHASPALLIAIDCVSYVLAGRAVEGECACGDYASINDSTPGFCGTCGNPFHKNQFHKSDASHRFIPWDEKILPNLCAICGKSHS